MHFLPALTQLKTKTTATWMIIGFMIMLIGGLKTESAFSKVNYPGSDFGGVPLTFDLQLKQENLRILERQATLDLFVTVQFLDIGIIVGTLIFFSFLTLLILKFCQKGSLLYVLGQSAVILFLIAPTMDALENITVLTLISHKDEYELIWLSFLNSLFTLGKIGCFYIGWLLLGIVVFGLTAFRLNRLVAR